MTQQSHSLPASWLVSSAHIASDATGLVKELIVPNRQCNETAVRAYLMMIALSPCPSVSAVHNIERVITFEALLAPSSHCVLHDLHIPNTLIAIQHGLGHLKVVDLLQQVVGVARRVVVHDLSGVALSDCADVLVQLAARLRLQLQDLLQTTTCHKALASSNI